MLLPARPRSNLPAVEPERKTALSAGVWSVLVPGAGQLWQRRYGSAAIQFLSFAAYIIASFRYGGGWWGLGATVVNLWSAADAWWWARESGEDEIDSAPTE